MSAISILVVEDEFFIALDLKNALEKSGYSVLGMVSTGEQCLEFLARTRVDIVLMDIKLDMGMDGIDVARLLNDRHDIPVIFITAHSDEATLQKAKKSLPYGYIIKPINKRELHISIETALYKHRLDQELKWSEKKYRTLFENSRDPVCVTDPDFIIRDLNAAMAAFFGADKSRLADTPLRELFAEREVFAAMTGDLRAGGRLLDREMRLVASGGSIRECLITASLYEMEPRKLAMFEFIIRDITEEKRVMADLMRSREEMRMLSEHAQNLREQERLTISREIHDVLGQMVTALKMDFVSLFKTISHDSPDSNEKRSAILAMADRLSDMISNIASQLRPSILDDLGVAAAIEWQAAEFSKRTGIETEVNLTRLRNIWAKGLRSRYSGCCRNRSPYHEALEGFTGDIDLSLAGSEVGLLIRDNGGGIPPEKVNNPLSLGLIGMRERVASCGGVMAVSSMQGQGASIEVRIPSHAEIAVND
jgi:two-component system sensor histidine kinase UhpB